MSAFAGQSHTKGLAESPAAASDYRGFAFAVLSHFPTPFLQMIATIIDAIYRLEQACC
jgi:hypothetical protein